MARRGSFSRWLLPMSASAALLAGSGSAASPQWDFIGTSDSGLRIFVDRSSVIPRGGIFRVTVRLGAPRAIVGKIVLARQTQDQNCKARTWRQVGFEALDDSGSIVARSTAGAPPSPFLPIEPRSVAAAVHDAVCPGERNKED